LYNEVSSSTNAAMKTKGIKGHVESEGNMPLPYYCTPPQTHT